MDNISNYYNIRVIKIYKKKKKNSFYFNEKYLKKFILD